MKVRKRHKKDAEWICMQNPEERISHPHRV